ncbi:DUF2381 family protein [Hyalangium rubrum]|uniref:DUF2381 family protein n=1 Tax=Hyalangium rubrum TaxID=3103134 RepID=A0ABU5H174_9BACT|nr:DUF2381 family protein [Hyalangium sp. s54d21]MDY7225865.1 DUF2381 family protein [Hyalangium sp. s54d21]
MFQPTAWLLLALVLLVAAPAAAQPLARLRQDRRVSLSGAPAEPVPEVRVAAGHLTTLVFNAPLERDTLEFDTTRFKLADPGERSLSLEPTTDLGAGERLVVKVRFKDRALPGQAVFAVVSHATEVDGRVEVDRRANTPEALMAALTQTQAELERLKSWCEVSGPARLAFSGQMDENGVVPVLFRSEMPLEGSGGLEVTGAMGYMGKAWALLVVTLHNSRSKKPWRLEQTRLSRTEGVPLRIISARMNKPQLAPGENGMVAVELDYKELKLPSGARLRLDLRDSSNARPLSLVLVKQ